MLLSPAPTGFSVADPHSLVQYLTYVPRVYATEVVGLTVQAIRFPSLLTQGLTFSASLLAILTAHEFGHYFLVEDTALMRRCRSFFRLRH